MGGFIGGGKGVKAVRAARRSRAFEKKRRRIVVPGRSVSKAKRKLVVPLQGQKLQKSRQNEGAAVTWGVGGKILDIWQGKERGAN